MSSLAERMRDCGYDGYTYSYPHKTAYRPLTPVPLQEAWRHEDKTNLFLYVHLPFCEMRCGFCNLFTTVLPKQDLVQKTLAAIQRQSEDVAGALQPVHVAQAAFGGGTPTYLAEAQLEQLFNELQRHWPVSFAQIPVSFEASPGTVTPSKLALLKQLGVDRLSLGVQSFVDEDLRALRRRQPPVELEQACQAIKDADFPVFNIDLIYGNPEQTPDSWRLSLERALAWQPEELYLYPLYVGKLTNLDRASKRPGQHRRLLYELARDLLTSSGYLQVSMRQFRRRGVLRDTDYCCQQDGMVGLGPGARSYTRALHYSSEYAVGQLGVRRIIHDFCASSEFSTADYGIELDAAEQKRRYLLKSLLRADGLAIDAYQSLYGTHPCLDHPELQQLLDLGLARLDGDSLQLTPDGLGWSDTIGPWLYSPLMHERMGTYQLT